MSVVAHHPIIIHIECIFIGFNSVDNNLIIVDIQCVMLIGCDTSVVKSDVFRR